MPFERIRPFKCFGQTEAEKLSYLERFVRSCAHCKSIAKARTGTVFGEGSLEPNLLFIGEAPGSEEDASGRPFVGRAGQLLRSVIGELELGMDHVYIANVLKCRPDTPFGQGNRPPSKPEMDDCLPYLLAQIEILDPNVIVAMGNTAISALGSDETISQARGTNWVFRRRWDVYATWHPSYVLQNPGSRKQFKEDIDKAAVKSGL
jgi:DNA polymerase